MPEKKNDPGFTVTDRRLFRDDGESRPETAAAEAPTADALAPASPTTTAPPEPAMPEMVAPPSAAEQSAQADAYKQTTRAFDDALGKEIGGPRPEDLEVTLERFLASIYMSALVQLGLAHERGGTPRVDLLGARQSIDTIALLQEKTKGNLTAAEKNFIQNSLYELRMAYLKVTNALTRPPQPGEVPGTKK
jgi:Domain of unknown function (DUF1844)